MKIYKRNRIFSKKQSGFTLIELLIVIAIIGLLASVVLVGLTNARKAGRDARRVADLKTIQNALELYYNRCGYYPGRAVGSGSACPSFSSTDFTGMSTALTGSNIGVGQVPRDPDSSASYFYKVNNTGQEYVLGASLEDTGNRALNDDLDGTYGSPSLNCGDPTYCTGITSGNF